MARALAILCLCPLVAAAQDKEAEVAALKKKVDELTLELEAARKAAPAADSTKTVVATKVVGTWAVAGDSLKDAIFTDLVLKADGKCDFSTRAFGPRMGATYTVIGRQLSVTAGVESWNRCRVACVTDAELILEHLDGDMVKKVKYQKEK